MPPVDRLTGEQAVVHPVDEVRADIGEALALLGDVEIPGRALTRHARNLFHQMVHAVDLDRRLGGAAGKRRAEHVRVVYQRTHDLPDRIVPPAHQVSDHQPVAIGGVEHLLQHR